MPRIYIIVLFVFGGQQGTHIVDLTTVAASEFPSQRSITPQSDYSSPDTIT